MVWLILIFAAMAPGPAAGQTAVDLELILMADGSGSVDTNEFELQRLGYVKALRHPRILNAIQSGPLGQIALAYTEWSGPALQVPIVAWSLIRSAEDIEAFAKKLEAVPRMLYSGGTAIGDAILYGVASINENAYQGRRKVIDISGDGPDRGSLPAFIGRDQAIAEGMTVNGLPILEGFDDLAQFFRDNVIGGPGAFAVPATGFKDFATAVRLKLIREIAARPSPHAAALRQRAMLSRLRGASAPRTRVRSRMLSRL
jgi:hypothetical protein